MLGQVWENASKQRQKAQHAEGSARAPVRAQSSFRYLWLSAVRTLPAQPHAHCFCGVLHALELANVGDCTLLLVLTLTTEQHWRLVNNTSKH